jgi:hypothetical protein
MPDKKIDIDAAHLRFDPSSRYFYEDICEDIPTFKEYNKHSLGLRKKIFAWIVCMYDMNTPLRREIKDLYKRKVYAATLVGLNPLSTTGKYKNEIEKILTGQDKDVNELVVKYIASFSSPEYAQLTAHVAIQHNILNKIVRGNASKDNQIMFDTATEKIQRLTNVIYGSGERDEVYEARRALYKQVSYDLSDMRAEGVVDIVQRDGGLPDEWNPYEPGYIPDDIHFVSDDELLADEDEV